MRLSPYQTFFFLFFVVFSASLTAQQKKQPNIIFFMVDDMGWQDCSLPFDKVVSDLNKKYHTPNMERLASRGMQFTNGYANPVCTPTRVSLMTGMDVPRHQVTNWTNVRKDTPTDHPDSLLQPPVWNHNGMSPVNGINNTIVATPLPALLRDAGYHTIHVGKAHFAPYGTPAADPLQIGFQENVAGTAAGHPGSFLAADQYRGNPTDTFWAVRGLEKYIEKGEFLTDALTYAALEKLDAVKSGTKPFFLYLSHYAVHVPLSKDERFYSKYIAKGLDDKEARFASLVEGMDKSLGDLLDYLDQNGLSSNTNIVFMSDNGSLSLVPARGGKAFTHNLPLKQGKGSLYEGGIRVPLIVAGPGIPAGAKQRQYVGVHDFFPTMLEWAGVKKPEVIQHVDGQSIVPFLRNPDKTDDEKVLIWHYPNNWTNINVKGTSWGSAIRKGAYKLIYFHKTEEMELYNLENDLAEEHDLSAMMPEKLREMAALMTSALQSRNAPMPSIKSTGKQIPWPSDLINKN